MPTVQLDLGPETRGWGQRWLGDYKPLRFSGNFGGFTSLYTPDTIFQGQGKRGTTQTPDCLNIFSYPFGSVTSFFGHARINGSSQITESSTAKAITGLVYTGEVDQKLIAIAGTKAYRDASGTPTDITGTATITDSADNLADFAFLNTKMVMTNRSGDGPFVRTSGGSFAALGGSPPSSPFYCVTFDRRIWLFTAQSAAYSADNDAESYDTTDDTLPFTTNDGSIVTAARRVGNYLYVGKDGPDATEGHLFRVYRTGNPSLPYTVEELETGGIGPISQQAFLPLPSGDICFYAKDGNVYLLRGNSLIPIGRNIQRTILADYTKTRFRYASMGVLQERNLVGLSLTKGGSSHNRTWWYDYLNSRPGDPESEYWWPTDHAINAWGERVSGGQRQLVTGDYSGYYSQQLSGDSYAGSSFNKYRITPWHLLTDDPFTTYEVYGIVLVFEPTGSYTLSVQYRTDFDLDWSTAQTITLTGGAELGSFVLGTDVLGGDEQKYGWLYLNTRARRIQLRYQNTAADQPFAFSSYVLLVRRASRSVGF